MEVGWHAHRMLPECNMENETSTLLREDQDNDLNEAGTAGKLLYDRYKKRTTFFTLLMLAIMISVILISFMIGRYAVPVSTVLEMLIKKPFGLTGDWTAAEESVVINVRLPRIMAAIGVGSALSISGAAYQGMFRNPMVSPDILGASAGASVGACIAILMGMGDIAQEAAAFIVGILAVLLAYSLSMAIGRGKNMVLLLVLCGLVVSTIFQAGVSIIKYLADPDSTLPEITYWLMGSIAKVQYSDLKFFAIMYVIGVIPILLMRWRLNLLAFGEEEAKSLGVNINAIRNTCIISATLLTAACVSLAGTVGWVGLMIPHLVRFMVGPNYKTVIPLSLLVGATFLLVVDNFCRCMLAYEIPLGILTSMIGGPFFLILLFNSRKRDEL